MEKKVTEFDFTAVNRFEVIECVTQDGYVQIYLGLGKFHGFERINSLVKETPDIKNMQAKEFMHVTPLTARI